MTRWQSERRNWDSVSDSQRQILTGCFCFLLLLVLWPTGAALAQSPDFWAPGAVQMLHDAEINSFPDDIMARRWLLGFNSRLPKECNVEADLNRAIQLAQVSTGILSPVKVNQYILGTVPKAAEGVEDAIRFARAGCRNARQVATVAEAITLRNVERVCPRPSERPAFLQLLNPSVRRAWGVNGDGLTEDQRALRGRLTPLITRYLRTRQIGRLSNEEFREVSTKVAENIAISGMGSELISRLITKNEDGEAIVGLYLVDQIINQMTPRRNEGVFGTPSTDERLDQAAEDAVELLGQMVGNLGGGEKMTQACERRALLTMQQNIAQVFPPQIKGAFSTISSTWTPPEPGTTGTITGIVVVEGTGEPVKGAKVYPRTPGGSIPHQAPVYTDENGRFILEEVEPSHREDGLLDITAVLGSDMGGGAPAKITPGEIISVEIGIKCSIAAKMDRGCKDGLGPIPQRSTEDQKDASGSEDASASHDREYALSPGMKAPNATGTVRVTKGATESTFVIDVYGVPDVDAFDEEGRDVAAYAVWIVPSVNKVNQSILAGTLQMNEDGTGSFQGATDLERFGIIITATPEDVPATIRGVPILTGIPVGGE